MVIELIIVCTLAEGAAWKPPADWTVREVRAYDSTPCCQEYEGGLSTCWSVNCSQKNTPTRVVLAREAKAGETIEPPTGCTVSAEVRE